MITIPTHKDFSKNQERCKQDEYPCVVCGRPCSTPQWMIHLWFGTEAVTEEEATRLIAEEGDGADMGGYPVGSDCLKKHPELKPYAVKQED